MSQINKLDRKHSQRVQLPAKAIAAEKLFRLPPTYLGLPTIRLLL